MALRLPRMGALALLGALLVVATALGAALEPPRGTTRLITPGEVRTFVALLIAAGIVYLAAVALVLRTCLPRYSVWLVLGTAALLRLLVLPGQPFLSTDVYRYVWDGRVQAAGINPYRFLPADPALAALRDEDVFLNINRAATAPTIYPPMAQAIFLAAASLHGTVTGMKATMVAFEGVAVAVIVGLLGRSGLPRERVLIYAWHPLGVWEFAGNGHVDAAAMGLVALAWLARSSGRRTLAGAALAAATLVKLLPIYLLPALWRRWDLRLPAAFAAFVVVAYLPYLDAGAGVLGYLPGYAQEEKLSSGSGFYLLALAERLGGHLAPWAGPTYVVVAAAALLGLAVWTAFSRPRPAEPGIVDTARDLLLLGTAILLVLTPHYAWYFTGVIPFLCFVPAWPVLYLTVASVGLNAQAIDPMQLGQAAMYGPFLLLVLVNYGRRRDRGVSLPALAAGAERDHACHGRRR